MPIPTTDERQPSVHRSIDDLETPALLVNLNAMEANLREYASLAETHDLRLRSHVKTHKNAEIARLENEYADGGGIVCQTLGEVEVMAKNGLDDIAYVNASEEHGWLDTSDSDDSVEVGDRLECIVPHVCTTVNLHDTMLGVRDGRVEEIWDVQARGKVR